MIILVHCCFVKTCPMKAQYPYPRLNKPLRQLILILLIMSFFIISPLVIFYTAGYRYDFATHQIKQTGVISIDVEPRDVHVRLNDVAISKRIPIRLPNRAPGTYHLSITRDGYQPWERDITVESNKTTYIRGISLFKEQAPELVFVPNADSLQAMHASADGSYALLNFVENGITEVQLLETVSGDLTPILRTSVDQSPEIHWSPFDNYAVILTTDETGTSTIDIVNADNQDIAQTYTVTGTIGQFVWDQSSFSPTLLLQTNRGIEQLNSGNSILVSNTTSSVWFVTSDERVWRVEEETNRLIDESRDRVFQLNTSLSKIVTIDDKRLIGKTDNGMLVVRFKADTISQEHISASAQIYNESTNEWIAWSPWELWIIHEDGNISLLNRTSDQIVTVHPLDEEGVLLLATENQLIGFNPGYYISHTLLSNADIQSVTANVKRRMMYFLGTVNGESGLYEQAY